MKIVPIDLGERSYDIEIDQNALSRIGAAVESLGSVSRVALITDDNVEPLYAEVASQAIVERGLDLDAIVVPSGEQTKSLDYAEALWEQFLEIKIDRRSVAVALGGGVVGDLAGFVSATYARGIRYFQVPTTLLAQVDSSVGGKTAINLPSAKNMVGAFHQPSGVLIDPTVLNTLSDDQYRAGLGEVVKYGASLDENFFAYLEQNTEKVNARDPIALETVISRCCELKAEIVKKDERETSGLRALLNYGHTFGHALESRIGHGKLLHGFGVALGCSLAARLAFCLAQKGDDRFSDINESWIARQDKLFESLGLPTRLRDLPAVVGVEVDCSPEKLVELMSTDKKTEFGQLNFVLPRKIGDSFLVRNVSVSDVLDALHLQ
ncbi:MAG: 3-dehydroquinate synthase [Thermoguttaceae bacterium]|nr:3-dehydroquinate synthase [Thermoguttaceae bacterium]